MPPLKLWQPRSLEDQCITRYIYYLKDETDIIFHLRAYDTRSVLLRNVSPNAMFRTLDRQLCQGLTGILQELVRQKMTNILIQVIFTLQNLAKTGGYCYPTHQKCFWISTLPGPPQPGPGGHKNNDI